MNCGGSPPEMAVLTFRDVELRDLSVRRCWFSVASGWREGIEVRGRDAVIVGAPGQFTTSRQKHARAIRLIGTVLGEDEENWSEVCGELEAIFDESLLPGTLEVTAPYLGQVAGSMSIEARCTDYRTIHRVPYLVTDYDVTLLAIGDPITDTPPDWQGVGS
jgi:hypothetical protein